MFSQHLLDSPMFAGSAAPSALLGALSWHQLELTSAWLLQVQVHSKAEERDLERELRLASTADHPNIVRHLCAYYCEDAHGDQYVWIAMEMMAHGALNLVFDRGWRQWVSTTPAEFDCSQPGSDCWNLPPI
jgi:serine/threonine protein kinase